MLWTHGVRTGRLSEQAFVAVLSTNQARIHGLAGRKGALVPGADADIVVWDPAATVTVTQANRHGRVDYTPYEGMTFVGGPATVYLRGARGVPRRRRAGRARRRPLPGAGVPAGGAGPGGALMPAGVAGVDAPRAIAGLRELARLTGDADGAQRVAWTDTWSAARRWLRDELDGIAGVEVETDEAGNVWATAAGRVRALRDRRRPPRLGARRRLARRRAERRRRRWRCCARWPASPAAAHAQAGRLGRRGGRALRAQPDGLERVRRHPRPRRRARAGRPRRGSRCRTPSRAHGVDLDRAGEARRRARGRRGLPGAAHRAGAGARAASDCPLGVVLGTFGVAAPRRALHRAARPRRLDADGRPPRRLPRRRPQRAGLPRRGRPPRGRAGHDRGRRASRRASSRPSTGCCELSLDQRALDAGVLAEMLAARASASAAASPPRRAARSTWEPHLGRSSRSPSPPSSSRSPTGWSPTSPAPRTALPSGPLHDAAEMARVVPTVMLFVKSLGGREPHQGGGHARGGPRAVGAGAGRAHAPDPRLGRGGPEATGAPWTSASRFQTDPPARAASSSSPGGPRSSASATPGRSTPTSCGRSRTSSTRRCSPPPSA